jgi:hypothetical protein
VPALIRLVLIPLVLGSATTHAQQVIRDELSCLRCEIVVESIARIGDGPGSVPLPGSVAAVDVDARGRYWVVVDQEPIMVFDAAGEFVATVGEMGDGPGELRFPSHVAMAEDAAIIFDGAPRAVIFDLDFNHVRTVALTVRRLWEVAAVDGGGQVLVNGLSQPAGEVRLPFTVLDVTRSPAAIVHSFGPDLEDRSSRVGLYRLRHVLAAGADNTFWAAELQRYHLSRWRSDGERIDSLVRQPEWFSGVSRAMPLGGPETEPDPAIAAIAQDSAGLLWVFIRVTRPGWRDTWAEWISQHGPLPAGSAELSGDEVPPPWDQMTTTVEVLDPRARRVVHRQTLDALVVNALPGPRLVTYSESAPAFDPVLEVIALRLDESGR